MTPYGTGCTLAIQSPGGNKRPLHTDLESVLCTKYNLFML